MSSNELSIPISNTFKPGNYMTWLATTQAAFLVHMKLYDNEKVYFDKSKQSTDFLPPLDQDAALIAGTNLTLYISIPDSKEIKPLINNTIIMNGNDTVASLFTVCAEDENDHDYNDVYVSLVAWEKKG